MILGYVTSGFAYHRLEDAVHILAEIGYRSVAVTLDEHHLNPFDDNWPAQAERIKRLLGHLEMRCTVETGARFLLDPRRKHRPTLLSTDPEECGRRVEYLCRAVDVAAELEADSVSLWSGAADDDDREGSFDRLAEGLRAVLDHAASYDMPLSFEPEPGMLIERMAHFQRLFEAVDHPLFGLTLDLGHVHCLGDGDLLDHLLRWRHVLFNVHIEDMCRGRHEHLFFGEGEMNFTELMGMMSAVRYRGPLHVELPRHSHDAPSVAARAYDLLSALVPEKVFEKP